MTGSDMGLGMKKALLVGSGQRQGLDGDSAEWSALRAAIPEGAAKCIGAQRKAAHLRATVGGTRQRMRRAGFAETLLTN
jgi:hypothetical protein